ncbi:hypothetical protein N9L68_05685 [bacterium]|nr:hypothetical protein [bacterium]
MFLRSALHVQRWRCALAAMPLVSIQKHNIIYILLLRVAPPPRRLARVIAHMMVRIRTLAPQPSEFYDLVPREAGEPFRSGLSP